MDRPEFTSRLRGSVAFGPGTTVAISPDMRRDMQKSWRWFYIGRLAIMLAFTPEVRAAEVTVPYTDREPATADAKRARLLSQVRHGNDGALSPACADFFCR
jgi:hypothetical protein